MGAVVNRSQRRRAAHHAKRNPKNKESKQLSQRSRFEQDLREALLCADIKLISTVPGQEQDATTGRPTGAAYWVFTLYAGGRFVTVKSSKGPLADVASGVTRAVREALEKGSSEVRLEKEPLLEAPSVSAADVEAFLTPQPPALLSEPEDITLAERIERAERAAARGELR